MFTKFMILVLMLPAFVWWLILAGSAVFPNWSSPLVLVGGLGLVGTGLSIVRRGLSIRTVRIFVLLLLFLGIGAAFTAMMFAASLYLFTADPDIWEGLVFYVAPMLLAIISALISIHDIVNYKRLNMSANKKSDL